MILVSIGVFVSNADLILLDVLVANLEPSVPFEINPKTAAANAAIGSNFQRNDMNKL